MKLLVIILSIFLLASCDCGCDTTEYGKHKFHRGDIVHTKISNDKILILDTIRLDYCELAYSITDKNGDEGYAYEIELK